MAESPAASVEGLASTVAEAWVGASMEAAASTAVAVAVAAATAAEAATVAEVVIANPGANARQHPAAHCRKRSTTTWEDSMTDPKRLHHLLRVAAFCGAGLILASAYPAAAQPAPAAVQPSPAARTAQPPASPAAAALQTAPKGDLDQRVRRLHEQLGITPEQEELWRPVAAAMVDSASGVSDAMQARFNKTQPMSAIDDIRTYQAVASAHAKGLMHLADAFTPLYTAMPPAQQKAADKLFGTQMARHTK